MTLSLIQQQFFLDLFSTEKKSSPFNEQRFSIYRQSVHGHLLKCLHDLYPVCLKLVGEVCFNALADFYILDQQFLRYDVNLYGDQFADFLQTTPIIKQLPYLPDVAQLEWYEYLSSNAENNRKLSLAQWQNYLQQDNIESIILAPPKSGFLIQSLFPIHKIWQINQENYQADTKVDLQEGAVYLLLWRDALTIKLDPLTSDEWQILNAFQQRKPLGALLCDLAKQELDLVPHLTLMVQNGWLEISVND